MEPSFVPFKQRGDTWQDIEPIEQYEGGPAPIAPIPYPPAYTEVMGYFRAILKAEEISPRAYALTEEVIGQSQGNYTAWFYRRKCLDALKLSLVDEMKWLQACGLSMEKNYQIWHHRRCIVEILGDGLDGAAEMEFLRKIFESDAKNFHAWSYRIWLVERFQLWAGELEFSDELLNQDVCNNSVWSYRYFVLNRSPPGTYAGVTGEPGSHEFVQRELQILITNRIPQNWGNEASWVYLRGLLCNSEEEAEQSQSKKVKRVYMGKFKKQLAAFLDQGEELARQHPDSMGLRFILQCQADLNLVCGTEEYRAKAFAYLEELRDSADKIRMNYWQWRINKLKAES